MKAFIVDKFNSTLNALWASRLHDFPQTSPAMDLFIKRVLEAGRLQETPSMRSLVAQAVLHCTQGAPGIRPKSIIAEIERATANHIAYAIIDAVKQAEKAKANDKPVQD